MKYPLANKAVWLLLGFLTLSIGSFAIDLQKPLFEQKPVQSLVQDYAQVLQANEAQQLEVKLNQYNQQTSTQILFVSVPDLLGYDKNDYATRLGEAWGVGGKADNGIVILLKPKNAFGNGQVSIQVGYGIESLIPDAIAKRIVELEMVPSFKQGNYYAGIDSAVNVMMSLTQGEFTGDHYLAAHKGKKNSTGFIVLIILFIVFVSMLSKRGKNVQDNHLGGSLPFWMMMGMMSGRGGGGFGGGSSGGGFGGFGGGSFGGGGAGGSW